MVLYATMPDGFLKHLTELTALGISFWFTIFLLVVSILILLISSNSLFNVCVCRTWASVSSIKYNDNVECCSEILQDFRLEFLFFTCSVFNIIVVL